MRLSATFFLLLLVMFPAASAVAQEGDFLRSLSGRWSGKGTVIMRLGKPAISVNCQLRSTAGTASLSMKATCRGLLVVSRTISADLQARGMGYSGVYVGPSGGRSALSGSRKGQSINLAVRWSRVINGDRQAQMTIQKVGARGMRLRTVDRDPATGKTVVTSDIQLQRN